MARILVVDDSALVVRFLERTLGASGHVVEALDSFIQLATAIRVRPPDLLILDLHMPALSGLSTGKLVRAHQTHAVPILIYSSASDAELRRAAHEVRAQGYLQKGCDTDLLLRTVEQILTPRRAVEG